MAKSISFYTLGCKLNFSESSALSQKAEEAGFTIGNFNEPNDVYVINTCSVTDQADKKCRQFVRRALRKNPKAYIVVVGCYAQLKPKEIAEIPGVDAVLGASEKFNLIAHLQDITKNEKGSVHACEIEDVTGFNEAFSYGDRTRTFLKVQDGCDYTCSFCTIPLARGKSRSANVQQVVEQVKEIAQTDAKEIVLTGVNLGDFGKGPDGNKKSDESFYELIQELDNIEGIDRFRISSIEPNLLSDEIIEFVAQSKRFVPHFHIPLQSGSNAILGKMRRRYQRELYASRVSKIKELMPHCAIGVDVIVGFPGETDEHFKETYHFLNELPITYLHVFTYSERDNTLAPDMEGEVSPHIRNERNKMLRILSDKKQRAFTNEFIGTNRPALIETEERDGYFQAYTDNYIRVQIPIQTELANTIQPIQLQAITAEGIVDGQLQAVAH